MLLVLLSLCHFRFFIRLRGEKLFVQFWRWRLFGVLFASRREKKRLNGEIYFFIFYPQKKLKKKITSQKPMKKKFNLSF